MTVRTAVEKAEAPDTRPKLSEVVHGAIARQSEAFAAVLPDHVDPDRFSRLVLAACKATPQLMECFATQQGGTSLLIAAMQAAAVGLEPNTPTQEAWLLPRRRDGVMECQLSIGYRGYLALARRAPNTKTVTARVVYEGDDFDYAYGLDADTLEHRPAAAGVDRGALTHAYALVRYLNGGTVFVVLNRDDVEARRARSDSWRSERARPYSPWTTAEPAMWAKSAVRALVPFLDLRVTDLAAIRNDDRTLTDVDPDTGLLLADPTDIDADDGALDELADTADPVDVEEVPAS